MDQVEVEIHQIGWGEMYQIEDLHINPTTMPNQEDKTMILL